VWLQNFFRDPGDNVRWRTAEEGIPPSRNFLGSPIDPDCRYARKFTTSWVGYRVHLTETCDDGAPSVLTDLRTAPATVADGEATPLIHQALEEKGLLPETQFVDTGYLDAELLFESKERYGVTSSVPPDRTASGRPRKAPASRPPLSPWTGRTGSRPARRARRASAGARP